MNTLIQLSQLESIQQSSNPNLMMESLPVTFYAHPQDSALTTFLPILHPHLPTSNPLYNRLRAPHNLPSRHCLFAATFPPGNVSEIPEVYTILFADRSRHLESQIWIFNPLIMLPTPFSSGHQDLLTQHLESAIHFLKDTQIPEAPGWPFSPVLRFGCVHETIASVLLSIGNAKDAIPRHSSWNCWFVDTAAVGKREKRTLPDGFQISRVPDDQLDVVISASSIPRQASTLKLLPSVGLLNVEDGRLVAWGYVGVDGSFATLYVLPEYRGKGLAKCVAEELVGRLGRGEFTDLGFDGRSGWCQSDVYEGNQESEGVMRSLGGTIGCTTQYVWVDSSKI